MKHKISYLYREFNSPLTPIIKLFEKSTPSNAESKFSQEKKQIEKLFKKPNFPHIAEILDSSKVK